MKPGRKKHEPTDEIRKKVAALVGFGIPMEQIAPLVDLSMSTINKYYRTEIDSGTAQANAKIAQSLYTKALGDSHGSVTAAIFWLKTRAGWKETSVSEVKTTIDFGGLSDNELARIASVGSAGTSKA